MSRNSRRSRKIPSLPRIEGEARDTVREAFRRLLADARAGETTTRQMVKIHNVLSIQRQLTYWRNVQRALRWAYHRLMRERIEDIDSVNGAASHPGTDPQ